MQWVQCVRRRAGLSAGEREARDGVWELQTSGKDRYPYPVGYNAIRAYNGHSFKMEVREGARGPLFVVSFEEGMMASGDTPTIAWQLALKKKQLDGVELFGFSNPLVQRLLRELVSEQGGGTKPSNTPLSDHGHDETGQEKAVEIGIPKSFGWASTKTLPVRKSRTSVLQAERKMSDLSEEGELDQPGVTTYRRKRLKLVKPPKNTKEQGEFEVPALPIDDPSQVTAPKFGQPKIGLISPVQELLGSGENNKSDGVSQEALEGKVCKESVNEYQGQGSIKGVCTEGDQGADEAGHSWKDDYQLLADPCAVLSEKNHCQQGAITNAGTKGTHELGYAAIVPDSLDGNSMEGSDKRLCEPADLTREASHQFNPHLGTEVLEDDQVCWQTCTEAGEWLDTLDAKEPDAVQMPFNNERQQINISIMGNPDASTGSFHGTVFPGFFNGSSSQIPTQVKLSNAVIPDSYDMESYPMPMKEASSPSPILNCAVSMEHSAGNINSPCSTPKDNSQSSEGNTQKGDSDSLGQELTKSMITLLLPQALQLLVKDKRRKRKISAAELVDVVEAVKPFEPLSRATILPVMEEEEEAKCLSSSPRLPDQKALLALETQSKDHGRGLMEMDGACLGTSGDLEMVWNVAPTDVDGLILDTSEKVEATAHGLDRPNVDIGSYRIEQADDTECINVDKTSDEDQMDGPQAETVHNDHADTNEAAIAPVESIVCETSLGGLERGEVDASIRGADAQLKLETEKVSRVEDSSTADGVSRAETDESKSAFSSTIGGVSRVEADESKSEAAPAISSDPLKETSMDDLVVAMGVFQCEGTKSLNGTRTCDAYVKETEGVALQDEARNTLCVHQQLPITETLELKVCLDHPMPVVTVKINVQEFQTTILACCGFQNTRSRVMCIYRVADDHGQPSLIGIIDLDLCDHICPIACELAESNAIHFTPNGRALILADSFSLRLTPKEHKAVATHGHTTFNGIQVLSYEDGNVCVQTRLSSSGKHVCCLLPLEPCMVIAGGQDGFVTGYIMDIQWRSCKESFLLPLPRIGGQQFLHVIALSALRDFPSLAVGCDNQGMVAIWNVANHQLLRASMLSVKFPSQVNVLNIVVVDQNKVVEPNESSRLGGSITAGQRVAASLLVKSSDRNNRGALDLHPALEKWTLELLRRDGTACVFTLEHSYQRISAIEVLDGMGVVGTKDGCLLLWDTISGSVWRTFDELKGAPISCIAKDQACNMIAAARSDGRVLIYSRRRC